MSSTSKHEFTSQEALDLIAGPRMEFYGPPSENLQDIADVWTPYVRRAMAIRGELDATDVCSLMILLKVMRQVRGYNRDSATDISGYAVLAEVLNEPEAFRAFIDHAAAGIEDPQTRFRFINRFLSKKGE